MSGNITWAKIKDFIIIAVIPGFIWIMSQVIELESDRVKNAQLRTQVTELKSNIETLKNTDLDVAVRMARLETRLDGISSDLAEIKSLIRNLK